MRFHQRVTALEKRRPEGHSPAIKAWLGWPLTEEERCMLDSDPAVGEPIDLSKLSKEEREWLGMD